MSPCWWLVIGLAASERWAAREVVFEGRLSVVLAERVYANANYTSILCERTVVDMVTS